MGYPIEYVYIWLTFQRFLSASVSFPPAHERNGSRGFCCPRLLSSVHHLCFLHQPNITFLTAFLQRGTHTREKHSVRLVSEVILHIFLLSPASSHRKPFVTLGAWHYACAYTVICHSCFHIILLCEEGAIGSHLGLIQFHEKVGFYR